MSFFRADKNGRRAKRRRSLAGRATAFRNVRGLVFELLEERRLLSASLSILAAFDGGNGAKPCAGVTMDASGDLFGTTPRGGAYARGTIFELAKGSNAITTLAAFNGTNGEDTEVGLTMDASGNLFGTAPGGGGNGWGIVFELVHGQHTITTLATFNVYETGQMTGDLTMDASGDLFGTTPGGGASDNGTVFELAKGSNTITTLAAFNGSNGDNPYEGVTMDASGDLFGTTYEGGPYGCGTVFELGHGSNTITTLATFNGSNGETPIAGLTMDASGNLFGTTYCGGAYEDGTVFELAKGSNTITTLAAFNGSNGSLPSGSLTMDASGDLFGTTNTGGAYNFGTVFEMGHGSNTITTLESFSFSNGTDPVAGLTMDASGNLFGTTSAFGAGGDGTIFELTPDPFLVTVVAPPSLTATGAAVVTIQYQNTGATPMPAPIIQFTASQNGEMGAFLSLDPSLMKRGLQFQHHTGRLQFLGGNSGQRRHTRRPRRGRVGRSRGLLWWLAEFPVERRQARREFYECRAVQRQYHDSQLVVDGVVDAAAQYPELGLAGRFCESHHATRLHVGFLRPDVGRRRRLPRQPQ